MKKHLLIWLIIPTLFSCSIPKKGIVGEYLFEGNANDNSTYKNNGNSNGATLAKGHRGKGNSAYKFNGVDQYISIPHAAHIDFDNHQDFTISFWVSVNDTQNGESPIYDIIRKWRGDTQGYPWAIVYYDGSARDSVRNTISFVRYDGSICRHSPALYSKKIDTGQYLHIVTMKEGQMMRLYINNQLVAEIKDTTLPANECGSHNNAPLTIGARGNMVRYFAGTVDDLRIYNRALLKKEIRSLYKH
jgi:hypothetical protein